MHAQCQVIRLQQRIAVLARVHPCLRRGVVKPVRCRVGFVLAIVLMTSDERTRPALDEHCMPPDDVSLDPRVCRLVVCPPAVPELGRAVLMAPERRDAEPFCTRVEARDDLLHQHVYSVRRRLASVLAAMDPKTHGRVHGFPNPKSVTVVPHTLVHTALILSSPPYRKNFSTGRLVTDKQLILPDLVMEHVVELVVHAIGISQRFRRAVHRQSSPISEPLALDRKRMHQKKLPQLPASFGPILAHASATTCVLCNRTDVRREVRMNKSDQWCGREDKSSEYHEDGSHHDRIELDIECVHCERRAPRKDIHRKGDHGTA
mmetsp:Transcript_41425/g.84691  ORF Transcript_41425/g.84691 Transcript_41425/m.84691 type:complete len:318 (-) Transcript_41425:176-1129(-)